uniref:Uncharacterized protein LOC100184753 n=1 Tax=Phallusia mammillata TaxID=59560 RepID=A0A6F9DIV8_9ASCI|nr:uncharacterized protein LOC100184753 [Phallusia mammillata]
MDEDLSSSPSSDDEMYGASGHSFQSTPLSQKPIPIGTQRGQDDGQTAKSVHMSANQPSQEDHEIPNTNILGRDSNEVSVQTPMKIDHRDPNSHQSEPASSLSADHPTTSHNQPSTSRQLVWENGIVHNRSPSAQFDIIGDDEESEDHSVENTTPGDMNNVSCEHEAVMMDPNPMPEEIQPVDNVDDQDYLVVRMTEATLWENAQNIDTALRTFNDSVLERRCFITNRFIDFSRPVSYERCASCGRCVLAEYAHEHQHCNACVVCWRGLTTSPLHHTDVCQRCGRQICQYCRNQQHYCNLN